MPDRKKHVEQSERLYGYGFEEIHEWMDGTVATKGSRHREDRHDPDETPEKARAIFKDKVPEDKEKFIEDVVLDHIELDNRERNSPEETGEENNPLSVCHDCSELLPSWAVYEVEITNLRVEHSFTAELCLDCLFRIVRNKVFSQGSNVAGSKGPDRFGRTVKKGLWGRGGPDE